MKSDSSRLTFDQRKHFSSVRMQQGRVQVDADWNEQADIAIHRVETEASDVIGLCGAPQHYPAFHIVAAISQLSPEEQALAGNKTLPPSYAIPDFLISAGRYYVDGILCENERLTSYKNQPDLPRLLQPALPPAISAPGLYLVYVDVWQRLVTALDDPSIREIALGGPDTGTRAKTVWQVKQWFAGTDPGNCLTKFAAFDALIAPSDGRLSARSKRAQTSTDPCVVPPGAGYTGLENQLYRVEIHEGGVALDATGGGGGTIATRVSNHPDQIKANGAWSEGQAVEIYSGDGPMSGTLAFITNVAATSKKGPRTLTLDIDVSQITFEQLRVRDAKATFKWSRDNGVVVTTIQNIKGPEVTVHDLGPDDALGFKEGQWVEIIDDALELNGVPGQLAQIIEIDSAIKLITLNVSPIPLDATQSSGVNKDLHPKMRRWDGLGAVKFHPNISEDHFLDLESGVQVRFFPGSFKTGDYWTAAARTATADTQSGTVEWPQDASSQPLAQLPFGIKHHYCRLAMLHWDGANFDVIQDCRNLFPPITELTNMFYAGGDGQEAMPNNRLPQPLQVGVFNGRWPVENAQVRFSVSSAAGNFGRSLVDPNLDQGRLTTVAGVAGSSPTTLTVKTGPDGLAGCLWQLDPRVARPSQQVEARLLDADGKPTAALIRFDGNLSIADQVAYFPGECKTLEESRTVQKAIDKLAHLVSLYEVSGNHQEVRPGAPLEPLVVLAANKCGVVKDLQVNFKVRQGGGAISNETATTDENGIATADWKLDDSTPNQQVEATIQDSKHPIAPPSSVIFNANLSIASQVAYDPKACPGLEKANVTTVQEAIDHLCEVHGEGCDVTVGIGGQFEKLDVAILKLLEDRNDVCICLLPGDHVLPNGLTIEGGATRPRVKIAGCGVGSHIFLASNPSASPFRAIGLSSFELRDVGLTAQTSIELRNCQDITIAGCTMGKVNNVAPFITIAAATRIRLEGNRVVSRGPLIIRNNIHELFAGTVLSPLGEVTNQIEFDQKASEIATTLAGLTAAKRKALAKKLEKSLRGIDDSTPEQVESLNILTESILGKAVDESEVQGAIATTVPPAQPTTVPGVAIVIADAADTWIEDNHIDGTLSLYGAPGGPRLTPTQLQAISGALKRNALSFNGIAKSLHIRDNVIFHMTVSEAMLGSLRQPFPITEGPIVARQLSSLYGRSFITDNVFTSGHNEFVMEHLAMTSNSFQGNTDAGVVVARAAIYVGNYAPNDIRLFSLAAGSEQVANLIINIVDA